MTARTEAAAIAREVLETAHEDDTITVGPIPDNKAAALALAADRVERLADRLDDGHLRYLIRTALNGETA